MFGKIDKLYCKLNDDGTILQMCSGAPLDNTMIEMLNPTDDFLKNWRAYKYTNGEFILDENYVEPPKPKTKVEILEQENAELKLRVEVMQGAIDEIIMNSLSV